jgi:tetratricopeptide (TPR) repeat protein
MPTRLEQLESFLARTPNDPFILFAIAKEYEKLANSEVGERSQTALAYYTQIVETSPDYVGVYYHLGKYWERAAEPDKALAVYKKGLAVAKAQADQHAYNELAAAHLNIDDLE